MKALIGSDIWSDPDFESLSAPAKLIVFWLLTSPARDNAGVVRVSHKRVAFDCSIPAPDKIIEEAVKSGSFVVDGDRIWIKNWIAKQIGNGNSLVRNNIMKNVQKLINSYPASLRNVIYTHYPELMPTPLQGGIEPPPEGQGKGREGMEGVIKDNNSNAKAQMIEAFAGSLAELYGAKLHTITPESKRAVWDRGITKEEADRVLLYVKKHRAGVLKDEPLIPTTANRALLGIGDLVDRAFAAHIPSRKDFTVKPMPTPPEPPPISEEDKAKLKKDIANLKKKIKRGGTSNEKQ